MKVTGSSIEQCEKDRPRGKCRRWRLWASTSEGRKSKRFRGTYTQAQDALKAWVSELEGQVPNAETFGAYAESWRLWREKSGEFSPNTVSGDAVMVRMLSRTPLAGMRMDQIGPDDCREALLWLRGNPGRGGEYRSSTMAVVHQALFAIMAQALEDGRVSRNPMASVKRPKSRPAERDALSPAEVSAFLDALDSRRIDGRVMALYVMTCLGLRTGEVCALRDSEVSGSMARVTSTVRKADGTVGAPKSEKGKRSLPVPPRLAGKVDQWRAARSEMGIGCSEWLCCARDGSMMSISSLGSWWRRERASLGCEGMTLHQLRHSNLSMMARFMSPFDLQRYAGWSSIDPARIYVHDDLDSVARAVSEAWE